MSSIRERAGQGQYPVAGRGQYPVADGKRAGRRPVRAPLPRRNRRVWAIAGGVVGCWLLADLMTGSVAAATVVLVAVIALAALTVAGLRALGINQDHPWVQRMATRPWRNGRSVLNVAVRHMPEVLVVTPSGSLVAPDIVELQMNPADFASLRQWMEPDVVGDSMTEAYISQVAKSGARFAGSARPEVYVVPDDSVPQGRFHLRRGLPADARPALDYQDPQEPGYQDQPDRYPPDYRDQPDGYAPDYQDQPDGYAPDYRDQPDGYAPDYQDQPDGYASDYQDQPYRYTPDYQDLPAEPDAPDYGDHAFTEGFQPIVYAAAAAAASPDRSRAADRAKPAGRDRLADRNRTPDRDRLADTARPAARGKAADRGRPADTARAADQEKAADRTQYEVSTDRTVMDGMATVMEEIRPAVPVLRLVTGSLVSETRMSGARAGRGTVELELPDVPTVSRVHATFTFGSGCWWVANEGVNGLSLNGVQVSGKQALSDGDLIRWGKRSDAPESRVEIG